MKVLVTGATGLVGTLLCKHLVGDGHVVVVVSRDPERSRFQCPFPAAHISWKDVEAGRFENIDGVIHLAGESISSWPWSDSVKDRIIKSRVDTTKMLITGFGRNGVWPKVWVNASAIGYYGDRGEAVLDEKHEPGSGFLADVCKAWEGALNGISDNTRVVRLRTGIVLSPRGGALAKMIPAFRLGLGGKLGDGRQWMSWIHIDDLVQLAVASLSNSRLSGPVNAVAPSPVTNAEFTRALGAVLHRPTLLTVPGVILKCLGEFSSLFLASSRVVPRAALDAGFTFKYTGVKDALNQLLDYQRRFGVYEMYQEQWIPKTVEEIFPFFCDAQNLERLTPPLLNFRVLSKSTPDIQEGTLIDYKLRIHGVPVRWRTKILDWQPGCKFVDTQLKGPYQLWHHTHEFSSLGGGALMTDRVLYRMHLWPLGDIALPFVKADVRQIFGYRRKVVAEMFGSARGQ